LFGDIFEGTTFVAKTTTLSPRQGNMPRQNDGIRPKEWFPRCIYLTVRTWLMGVVLNAVGLSGPGVLALLKSYVWQRLTEPFIISFMAVGETLDDRLAEWRRFLNLMGAHQEEFKAPFAIEINVSCPNVQFHSEDLVREVHAMLDIADMLDVPFIVNINLLVSPQAAAEISQHRNCDALSQANAIPFGAFPDSIPWRKIFRSEVSPLVQRGFPPGGYSGPHALPILVKWIREAASAGIEKPLIVGGGIQNLDDLELVLRSGVPFVRGVKFGILFLLRPWRARSMIHFANTWFARHRG
jgi:dihydroorotate dehydrogenase